MRTAPEHAADVDLRAREQQTLAQLARALDHKITLEQAAATLLSPALRGTMDGFIRDLEISHEGWIAWWRFLWEESGLSEIGCEHLETIEHDDGRYTMIGRWTALRDGAPLRSGLIQATYRLVDGLVAHVQTARSNYTFFAPAMRTRAGALWTMIRFARWRKRQAVKAASELPARASGGAPLRARELDPIRLLGEVLADRRPLEDAALAFAPEVIMHADHYTMRGSAEGWIRWVAFMRARGRVEGLRGEFDSFARLVDGTIVGSGYFHGFRHGVPIRSSLATARYRVEDGKIVELWSVRRNYTFVFGERFASRLGFWSVIARFGLTSALSKRASTTSLAAPTTAQTRS